MPLETRRPVSLQETIMSRKTWLVIILVLCSLCALILLCSMAGWLGYRVLSADTDEQEQTLSQDSLDSSAQVTEEPDDGAVLRLSGGLPPTLDPALVQDALSAEYVVHLFSGLVRLDGQLEIVPDVAERWEVSDDGRTYTFYLLPNAVFQDGRAISADDFCYSFERACSGQLKSPVALSYLGDIVGAVAFAQGQAERITGLRALDAHTLQIEIDAPKAYFLAKLTYPTAYLVDRQQVESNSDWLRAPNGSGPFVLQELSAERIVLGRNERYYREKPRLARVEYHLSGGLPITMYENDLLDIVEVASGEIERVLDPHNPLYGECHMSPELSVQYLGLNAAKPPFDDIKARQAFAHAIDKHKIADLVLKGTATAANGILPPGMPDYDEGLSGLEYDPDKARELWAQSRYVREGNVPRIVLSVSGTSGTMPPVTRAVLHMIEETLGIEMTVEQVEWRHFLRDLNQNRYQMFSAGWIADYPDSQNFLDILFHGNSAQNHTGYQSAEVDALLEQARVERDAQDRTRLYRQAEEIIVREASWVPLTHGVTYSLVKPHVKGYTASAGLCPWLQSIYFEE